MNSSSNACPKWAELEHFIENQVRALNAVGLPNRINSHSTHTNRLRSNVIASQSTTRFECPCCKEEHAIYMCTAFRRLSVEERHTLVVNNNLCINCLDSRHMAPDCSSPCRFRFCNEPQNSLLHTETSTAIPPQTITTYPSSQSQSMSQVILATAEFEHQAAVHTNFVRY